jgi:putative membrane protein
VPRLLLQPVPQLGALLEHPGLGQRERRLANGRVVSRFPGRLFAQGGEPDPRFSLANERTFLAWIRTSLALVAGGVALEALGLGLHPGLRVAASLVLIVAGVVSAVQAWVGWYATERALRVEKPLPSAGISLPLTIAVVIAAVLVAAAVVIGP